MSPEGWEKMGTTPTRIALVEKGLQTITAEHSELSMQKEQDKFWSAERPR